MATKKLSSPTTQHADIEWDKDGLPIAKPFGDFYFSRLDGLEESRYVFIKQNKLIERWAHLKEHQEFVIAETGFGTGLNFLTTWQQWQNLKQTGKIQPDARLKLISIEMHPLQLSDLKRSLSLWPELAAYSEPLIEQYPSLCSSGFHHLHFDDISLTLIIDEATEGLKKLLASDHPAFDQPQWGVDAWYLDGFSPAKNPDMWAPELFGLIHKLSRKNATASTFASTRLISDNWQNNGFTAEKKPGFGKKRELIRADLTDPYQPTPTSDFDEHTYNAPYSAPWYVSSPTISKRKIAIIGAGLAGCHTARSLANRGWQVTVFEQHTAVADEASGNPQGILYAKLSHKPETLSDFNSDALQFAQRHYKKYWLNSDKPQLGQQCGVLQLSYTNKAEEQHQRLFDSYKERYPEQSVVQKINREEASALSGIEQLAGGLWFAGSGWLNPKALCRQLLDHTSITLRTDCRIEAIKHKDNHWQLHLAGQKQAPETFPAVVIACANHAQQFEQTAYLPVKPIRGQVTYTDVTSASRQLKVVLCADGYIAPADDSDQHCLGASFNLKDKTTVITSAEQQENFSRLQKHFPAMADTLKTSNEAPLAGRAALRCTTPDYLPIVGAAPNFDAYTEDFALLRKNAKSSIPRPGPNWPNLYLNIGHGSRGLTYTPLCAEILAAQISAEAPPCSRGLQIALHPARFIIRGLIRNKI